MKKTRRVIKFGGCWKNSRLLLDVRDTDIVHGTARVRYTSDVLSNYCVLGVV